MNHLQTGPALIIFRIIFYVCSVYFLLMGIGMILFPHLLVKGVAGAEVSPVILGMLRGVGGAIIPYALLYYLTSRNPHSRRWGLLIIALANVVAVILDISSVFLGEYKLSYALLDLPVELLSLTGIGIIWYRIRKEEGNR